MNIHAVVYTMISSILRGDIHNVDMMLRSGTNPNTSDINGSALSVSILGNHTNIVKLLIAYGADINSPNKSGNTPLIMAARIGDLSIVTRLIYDGVDINYRNNIGMTALIIASIQGHSSIVKNLLDFDADPLIEDNVDKYSALIHAIIGENIQVVYILLDHGVDPNRVGKCGINAYDISLDHEFNIMYLLIKYRRIKRRTRSILLFIMF